MKLHEKRTNDYINEYGYDTWEKMFKRPNWREEELEDLSDSESEDDDDEDSDGMRLYDSFYETALKSDIPQRVVAFCVMQGVVLIPLHRERARVQFLAVEAEGLGDFAGGFWGVHGFSVDQDGNFYVAEVDSGRVQKFRPRAGANPAFMVGKPVYAAWK